MIWRIQGAEQAQSLEKIRVNNIQHQKFSSRTGKMGLSSCIQLKMFVWKKQGRSCTHLGEECV